MLMKEYYKSPKPEYAFISAKNSKNPNEQYVLFYCALFLINNDLGMKTPVEDKLIEEAIKETEKLYRKHFNNLDHTTVELDYLKAALDSLKSKLK